MNNLPDVFLMGLGVEGSYVRCLVISMGLGEQVGVRDVFKSSF